MGNDRPVSCEQLLAAMVGFDSVNGHITGRVDAEVKLANYLKQQATAMGFSVLALPVDEVVFNVLVTHHVSAEAPWLLFESHLDTVSVEGMSIDPFAGTIKAGRLYGRGACDTKGSGAAMLWSLKEYAGENDQPNNIAILFTTDEEYQKTGINCFAKNYLPTLGWYPAGAIVGEPTELMPVVAHNGTVRWTIRTKGIAAHSSNPANGRSAISMMMRVVDAIESKYIPTLSASHPISGKAQCSINVINGGVTTNIIAESCQIKVDRRLVPGEDGNTVLPEVERLLSEVRQRTPGLQVSQDEPFIDPPLDPAIGQQFAAVVQSVLGQINLPTELGGVSYGTDASNLNAAGVPTVVLGPGNIAQAHTKDEWLDLAQLHGAVEVYRNLMRSPL